jgi:hypothetical protein
MPLSLKEISDRMEINDLLIDYCEAVDSDDIDAFDNIFTSDAEIDYSAFGFPRANLQDTKVFLKKTLATVAIKQHMIANSRVKIEGDTASAKTLCFNPMALPQENKPAKLTHFGLWYLDKLVRTDQGWRICERVEQKSYIFALEGELS